MARSRTPGADSSLRDYLIEQATDFRRLICTTAVDGDDRDLAEYASEHLSRPVDRLAAGAAVSLHRYQLPDEHPMSPAHCGDPCGRLTLDEHDVLQES
jgi:hypothetical protein